MKRFIKNMFSVWSVHLILSSPFAMAEVLNTSASFVVHEKDMTQYIQDQTNKWLTPNQVIADDLAFDAPYHSSLHKISWQGNASLNWTKNSSKNIWAFDGQTTNLNLYAESFEVHDTLQVSTGSGTINVRVDSVCQNLNLSLPGQWKIRGEVPIAWRAGSLSAILQNVTMTPSSQAPSIKIGSCVGPAGMEALLNQQLAKLYSNPAGIQTSLVAEVQKMLNAQAAKVVAMMGKPVSFDLLGAHVVFTPTLGQSLTSGTWVLDGPLVLSATNGTGTKNVPQGYTITNMTDARASGFAFANNLWSEIMAFADRAGLFERTFKSTDVPQFQSFLSNRMQQFFVWSDLMNFSTSQLFNLNFDTSAQPSITAQENTFPGVRWTAEAPLYMRMDAVNGKSITPYTEFKSNTPAQVTVLAAAKNGALNVTYSVENLDMGYAFRKEFLKIRVPTFGIGMGLIDSSLESALTDKTWTFTMPDSASPLPGYRVNFKDVIFGKKTFRVEMGLQKK